MQENEVGHGDNAELEEAENCQSWPLSGVVKKKSLNTYEKRHRQNEKAKQKKEDVTLENDQRADNGCYEGNFKYIEENLFRDDDPLASSAAAAETSQSTGSSDSEKKTNPRRRMKETVKSKTSPDLPKGRLSTGKGIISIYYLTSVLLHCHCVIVQHMAYGVGLNELLLLLMTYPND